MQPVSKLARKSMENNSIRLERTKYTIVTVLRTVHRDLRHGQSHRFYSNATEIDDDKGGRHVSKDLAGVWSRR